METQVATDTGADAVETPSAPLGTQGVESTTTAGQGTDQAEPSQTLGWRKQLKGEYQTHEAAARFTSPTELFQDYLEKTQQLEGAIPKLSSEATDEDRAAWYRKIGTPESPDGYKLPEDQAGESKRWGEIAHEANLLPDQAHAVFETIRADRDKAIREAVAELKQEYGSDYDENIKAANQFIRQIGGDKALQAFGRSGAGSDPEIVRTFVTLAKMVSEDSVTTGRPSAAGGDARTSDGRPMLDFDPSLNQE